MIRRLSIFINIIKIAEQMGLEGQRCGLFLAPVFSLQVGEFFCGLLTHNAPAKTAFEKDVYLSHLLHVFANIFGY